MFRKRLSPWPASLLPVFVVLSPVLAAPPDLPGDSEILHYAPYLIARAKSADPETAKLAYAGYQAYAAVLRLDQTAGAGSANPTRHWPENAKQEIEAAILQARAEADGLSFRQTYLDASLKRNA